MWPNLTQTPWTAAAAIQKYSITENWDERDHILPITYVRILYWSLETSKGSTVDLISFGLPGLVGVDFRRTFSSFNHRFNDDILRFWKSQSARSLHLFDLMILRIWMWSIGLVVIKYIRFEYYLYILMLSVFLTLVRVFDPHWYIYIYWLLYSSIYMYTVYYSILKYSILSERERATTTAEQRDGGTGETTVGKNKIV